jgi:DNA-binding Lrp family transcriptional regulator
MNPKRSKVEIKALKLILKAGDEGLFQSELWKLLGVKNREASRIAKKYVDNGRVFRERVLYNGRWTFKIFSTKKYVTLDSIIGCPCLICPDVDKCYRGGKKDSTTCLDFTAWIDPRIEPLPLSNL